MFVSVDSPDLAVVDINGAEVPLIGVNDLPAGAGRLQEGHALSEVNGPVGPQSHHVAFGRGDVFQFYAAVIHLRCQNMKIHAIINSQVTHVNTWNTL